MDFSERFEMYLEAQMNSKQDIEDANNVIKMFKDEYGVELTEENASTFIAHLCAAYSRLVTKEEVEELPKEVLDELTSLKTYEFSLEVLNNVMKVTRNPLNDIEKGYALLHINNLIAILGENNEWKLD